ncbi:hypothetical protein GCM10017744_026290 [Streptomyces antimycoticus]|uniref:Uncharacterized protein n=1 Tax=Streptomyces antimycoticus TaxID=68175 RepID=A0A4D4KLH7_9ACTN|nr:hypothetical protein SANT12839_076050 [Streptomyces antimycoticus]
MHIGGELARVRRPPDGRVRGRETEADSGDHGEHRADQSPYPISAAAAFRAQSDPTSQIRKKTNTAEQRRTLFIGKETVNRSC